MDTPTQNEIDDVCDRIIGLDGGTAYPGMTYEEGVKDAIEWMQGRANNPLEE